MESAQETSRLLVVWHSRTGASAAMAQAAAQAAQEEIAVDCVEAADVGLELVLNAAAYLFVCPENLGSMSGAMKEFFDRLYYPALERIEGRPYATIIAAGSDGSGAQRQIDRIVTGWRLRRVIDEFVAKFDAQTPKKIMASKHVPEAVLAHCREIGRSLGAGTALGVF
ncbi:MAG: flavodoxin family protein [Erythrobacter sp.]|nr:flavodoxin family protein [Erythrobacter sp.]